MKTGSFGFTGHILPTNWLTLGILERQETTGRISGAWRKVYVIKAMMAQEVAPTQTEPPFKLTQLVVLAIFVVLAIAAAFRFHGEPVSATPAEVSQTSKT